MPSDILFFKNEISRMTELNAPELNNFESMVQIVQETEFGQREYSLVIFSEEDIKVVELPYEAISD
jgi:hypothetical protein